MSCGRDAELDVYKVKQAFCKEKYTENNRMP